MEKERATQIVATIGTPVIVDLDRPAREVAASCGLDLIDNDLKRYLDEEAKPNNQRSLVTLTFTEDVETDTIFSAAEQLNLRQPVFADTVRYREGIVAPPKGRFIFLHPPVRDGRLQDVVSYLGGNGNESYVLPLPVRQRWEAGTQFVFAGKPKIPSTRDQAQ